MDKNIGVILDGRYEVKKRIGVGGMADVYRAYDRLEGRDVAVKILKNEYTKNDEFLQRFKNESKAVSMLSHPNIVKVLDVGFNDEMRFIVMEYIDGITLKEYMESQQKLDWKEASHFTIQILRALGHAHDRGIIHRDIKPQNIMMFEDGTIKVMDFGIAKFTYEVGITETAQTIGSVHYISPEQAGGKQTDGASDIYSVGIILYEMLTGKKPFDTDNPLTVALMQMNDDPKMPRSINPDVTIGQQEVILKAMEKDSADRYHNAREMIRDIERLKSDPDHVFGYVYKGSPHPKLEEEEESETPENTEPVSETEPEITEQDPMEYDPDEATPNYYIDKRHESESRRKRMARRKAEPVTEAPPEYETPGSGLGFKLATVATVIGMITVVACLAGFISGFFGKKEDDRFIMPELVPKNYSEMVSRYSGDLVITIKGDPQLSEYAADTIIEQSIEQGSEIEKGAQVYVGISSGRNLVPDVTGLNATEACDKINKAGFKVLLKPIFNDKIAYDDVIRISPEAGTSMEVTGEVTLYVSKGAPDDSQIVPNVVGKQKEEAEKLLKDAGFIVEFEEKDDKAPEGEVISQNFPGDTLVNPKEKIVLYISTGKLPEHDVTIDLKFPEGATGVCTFRIYVDNEQTDAIEDINIEGFENYSIDVTGSEKKTVKIEIMNIFTGENEVLGEYKVDFEEDKVEVIKDHMKEALEKIGSLNPAETTVAVTTPSPSPSPSAQHSPTPASHSPSPSPSHSPSPSPSPSPVHTEPAEVTEVPEETEPENVPDDPSEEPAPSEE
jgi:serine/threonine-protein kinase